MDAASSEWKSEKGKGYYRLPKAGTEYTAEEIEIKVMHLKIKIRSKYKKMNRNKAKESDQENNVYHIEAERMMDIIESLTGAEKETIVNGNVWQRN